ncbi:hypothetical protein CDAR_530331 [Caerostris darwini]|uniref:Uncharacterized protein n=1 Tax=Caerostris darwini TaxID=1538125 RepID=A0AAV4QZB0_9ARAC|nr:hypothetical protein CDAR_530331 [Caerostris darwini]
MDTHSTATVNSAKTIFLPKHRISVSDKQEKPSASHPCPTRLMTVTLPPPVSRLKTCTENQQNRIQRLSTVEDSSSANELKAEFSKREEQKPAGQSTVDSESV